jgi:acyl carrier protein
MAESATLERVKKVVGNVLQTEPAEISDDADFVFDLGADSMQSVELVGAFEEEFEIEMEEDKALEIQTVSGAADFIQGYL